MTSAFPTQVDHDLEWNAGELGCGELVLELSQRMRLAPGKVFKVIALDAGAPADIPAWCRMTNNTLLAHDPQSRTFWIRAKT
jgi:tRNA 2-thiouridine synthesizing protein A